MKSLAQYLTEYLEYEIERQWNGKDTSQLGGWIKEGVAVRTAVIAGRDCESWKITKKKVQERPQTTALTIGPGIYQVAIVKKL